MPPQMPSEINRDVMFVCPGNLHVKSFAFPSKRRLACKSIKMKSNPISRPIAALFAFGQMAKSLPPAGSQDISIGIGAIWCVLCMIPASVASCSQIV